MFELGVFPNFLESDLLKVDKILGLTFFKARKHFEGFKTAFFHPVSVNSGLIRTIYLAASRLGKLEPLLTSISKNKMVVFTLGPK